MRLFKNSGIIRDLGDTPPPLLGKNTKKSCNFFYGCPKGIQAFFCAQELEQTREQVEVMYTGTDRLRSEYQRLCAGTRDLLASLRQQSISF